MDKSIYEKASAELILFDNSDVVVTSSTCLVGFDRYGSGCADGAHSGGEGDPDHYR